MIEQNFTLGKETMEKVILRADKLDLILLIRILLDHSKRAEQNDLPWANRVFLDISQQITDQLKEDK